MDNEIIFKLMYILVVNIFENLMKFYKDYINIRKWVEKNKN